MIILAEKPSVAAAFAAALGCPKKSGYYENNDYCIVAALGHLFSLNEPEDYNPAFKKWALDDLPIIPQTMHYSPIEKTKAQLTLIKECFKRHRGEEFLLATDAEREGELIGAEILEHVGFAGYEKAKRFWVSEALTPDVIFAGIKTAKPLSTYENYKKQGYARQHADWIVGMNLTRFVTLGAGTLLTVGRVQSAVLAAIYEREKQIREFTREKYIEVVATLKDKTSFSVKLLNPDSHDLLTRFVENASFAQEALRDCSQEKSGKIVSLKKETKTILPPQLYNLTALQKDAHKAFSYSPEQTLRIAQSLYEKHKCLSYPRTPSRVMGNENVELFRGIYDKLKSAYPGEAADTEARCIDVNNKRIFNSKDLHDHHALIPLDVLPSRASPEEKNVYHLVLTRFFTLLKPAYIYNSITLEVRIGKDIYRFYGKGIEVLRKGWMTGQSGEEAAGQDFSSLNEGAEYPLVSLDREEKFTEPKKHFTFASLLQLMENPRNEEGSYLIGLGTPATRGSILQALFDREYTLLQGKSILITDKGTFLIEALQTNQTMSRFISLYETTRWEEQLHNDTEAFLSGIKNFVQEVIQTPLSDKYQKTHISLGKCPLCDSPVCEGQKNYYCSGYKTGCSFVIWKEIAHATVSTADVSAMLSGKKTRLKKCKAKDGKLFSARWYLKNAEVAFSFEKAQKRS